jgi:hypothetical protein
VKVKAMAQGTGRATETGEQRQRTEEHHKNGNYRQKHHSAHAKVFG